MFSLQRECSVSYMVRSIKIHGDILIQSPYGQMEKLRPREVKQLAQSYSRLVAELRLEPGVLILGLVLFVELGVQGCISAVLTPISLCTLSRNPAWLQVSVPPEGLPEP